MRFFKALSSRLTDIRKIALIACTTAALSLPLTLWNAFAPVVVTVESEHPAWIWWVIPAAILLSLVAAIMPAFCFALYRDQGTLHVTKGLRRLSLVAAITFSLIVAEELPRLVGSLASYLSAMRQLDWRGGAVSVLIAARDSRSSKEVAALLGEFSNVAYIMLLIALFREADNKPYPDVPVSRFLTLATKVAVIAWGLVLAGFLLGLALVPYGYFELLRNTLPVGQTPPPLTPLMVQAVRRLLVQACLFTAPYVVYRSGSVRAQNLESIPQEP